MKKLICCAALAAALCCASARAAMVGTVVDINGYSFDLSQFDGAYVTYRADGDVTFDGKYWDQETGVDGYTLGELAAGQYGSDPGDQVSLNDRSTPDWLQLNYANAIEVSPAEHVIVIYEISSSSSGVDTEGLSFNVSFNGGGLITASTGVVSFFSTNAENSNQIVFDLYDFGFSNGDMFSTLYIENIDSGSGTSDPDFIFAGMAMVPEPMSLCLLSVGGLAVVVRRKK